MTTPSPSPAPVRRPPSDDIDLVKYFYLFVSNWFWFVMAVLLSLCLAWFISHYSPKVYKVSASLLIEDESKSSPGIGSAMFGGNDLMSGFGLYPGWYNLQNQMLILKSQTLISRTLHALDFGVSYYSDELFGPLEVLNEAPFIVMYNHDKQQPLGVTFTLEMKDDGSFSLDAEQTGDEIRLYNYLSEKTSAGPEDILADRNARFGELIEGEGYSFVIVQRETDGVSPDADGTWFFTFNSYDDLVSAWSKDLILTAPEQESSIVNLEVETACPAKAQLFIDKHLDMYLQRTLDKKNQVATNTIDFIDSQLSTIADSLDITEVSLQDYRRDNQVVDLSFQSQQLFEHIRELDSEKARLKMQDDYFRYLMDYLTANRESGDIVAPSVMGIDDPLLNNLVLDLNRMAEEKIAMSGSGISRNPYLTTLETQVRSAKARLEENTGNLIRNNTLAMQDVNRRLNSLMAEVRQLPQTERELLGIERKFKLNDNIYTFLLQRRAEAQIAKASNTPDNEVIDPARVFVPYIKPKPMRNYATALLAGLAIPAVVLILISAMSNKVTAEEDIKRITDIPLAGHIIHSNRDYQRVVLDDPKSQVAETFRSLRTRLQFFTKENPHPVILITSSMPSEGKTFASVNLASVYSLAGKKTVLVGFDLRKPKIYEDFKLTGEKGVSTFLIGRDSLDDILQPSGYDNLSVIVAGPVPPNPAELAASDRTRELFDRLRERFDYVIIDSAPMGAVSDAFSLAPMADVTLIMVRHRRTIKHILSNTIADAKANGITGMSLLLNDISTEDGVYGYAGRYRYRNGYGYYEKA
jgi:capsular exopolysaccharide synthesis family protein